MNEREELIKQLIKEKGGSREDYLSLLNKVAYHESAHTMDPSIKQQGGGPGRGKYQFEVGEAQGAITAARRTKQYFESIGKPVPQWLDKASKGDSLDASKLSSNQQDVLFLGNMRMHPKADFAKVWKGEETVPEFWAKYHWAGKAKDKHERLASFNESLEHYNNKYSKSAKQEQDIRTTHSSTADFLSRGLSDEVTQKQDGTNVRQPYTIQPQLKEQQRQDIPEPLFNENVGQDIFAFIQNRKQHRLPQNENELIAFNEGGTHEQNPLGGIPQGMGPNGKVNTVEEGETKFKVQGEDFIFSNRIATNGGVNRKDVGNNAYAYGGPTDPPTDKEVIDEMKDAKQYIKNYHNSPKFKERFINAKLEFGYGEYNKKYNAGQTDILTQNLAESERHNAADSYNKAIGKINENLDKGSHFLLQGSRSQPFMDAIVRSWKDRPNPKAANGSHYDLGRNIVFLYKDQPDKVGATHGAVAAHEFSHNAVSKYKNEANTIPKKQQEYIKSIQQNVMDKHDVDPYETKGDIDALRYMMYKRGLYDAGKEDFTIEHLNKAQNDKTIRDEFTFDRLKRLYNPEDLINLMNTLAERKKQKRTKSKLA